MTDGKEQCCNNPEIVVQMCGSIYPTWGGCDDNLHLIEICTHCGRVLYDESKTLEGEEIPF